MQKTIPDEVLLALALKNSGGGGGGTSDYESLDNLPKINDITLLGNKTASDLGLQSELTAGDNITIENGVISSTSVTVDDILSDESENPVQNKIINTALFSKANISDNENINAVQTNGTLPSLSVDSEGYINFDAGALAVLKSINVITRPYTIPSWSTGTDAEIIEALNKHYAGDIDLTQVWQVGDERTVHLSAMSADGVGESHSEQDVIYVLSNVGGKTLATPVSGKTTCAFQVDQKNCLNRKGYMNSTDTNVGGWKSSARRTWCNSVYKNAIPSTLRGIFKEFINQSGIGGGSSSGVENTIDTFALRARIEVSGSATATAEGEGSQITYYLTVNNRIKQVNGSNDVWWHRSPPLSYDDLFSYTRRDGSNNLDYANEYCGIATFGCI